MAVSRYVAINIFLFQFSPFNQWSKCKLIGRCEFSKVEVAENQEDDRRERSKELLMSECGAQHSADIKVAKAII